MYLLYIFFLVFFINACAGEKEIDLSLPDYSLDKDIGKKPAVEETDYYQDLELNTQAIPFQTSFPIGFAVGKSVSRFKSIPYQAQPPTPSRLTLKMGKCRLFVRTGPVQVHRYLYTNRFVKIGEEIRAASTVKMDPYSGLSVKMSSQLELDVPEATMKACWRHLYGRRTYLGRYHMYLSSAALYASPGSPRKKFRILPDKNKHLKGTMLYVHWNKGQKKPILKNEMDFPATVESSYFHAKLSKWGFYHIGFRPVLRSIHKNTLNVTIPTNNKPRKTKK